MKKITYQPPPRIGEKLRENVAYQGRPASELITSALESYLNAQPGDYPDPPEAGPILLPMYFMLGNPDGHFYDVWVGKNTVSGLFEGTARDFAGNWHTITGIEWVVTLETFLDAAYKLNLIAGYKNEALWFSDDGPDRIAAVWIADFLRNQTGTDIFYKVLSAAYKADWENEMAILAKRFHDLANLGKFQPTRLWDADIKTAALDLAGLFRACEGWPIQGV